MESWGKASDLETLSLCHLMTKLSFNRELKLLKFKWQICWNDIEFATLVTLMACIHARKTAS